MVQKVGNRSGMGGKTRSGNPSQRSTKRDRESRETLSSRLRVFLGYVPVALKLGLLVAIGVLVFLGYRAAASASFFQVRRIEARGINRASAEAIQATVRQEVGQTGVWRADLRELSAHLERLPWVRTAVVTRVLPDGIRVRITEREPKAVVRTSAGRFVWVDDDAVFLGEMLPEDQTPTFFLRGWNEEESDSARQENRERVKKFLELQRVWDTEGVSERVSEVNLLDFGDVRVQLSGDDSQIEIRLGSQDQAQRLKPALITLDKLRQTPRGPYISYLNVNQPKRVVVGLVSGAQAEGDATDSTGTLTTEVAPQGAPAARVKQDKEKGQTDKVEKDKGVKGRSPEKRTDQKRT